MKRWLIAASLALLAPLVWAVPTAADVEAQVRKGNYTQAESMMQEVVTARPQSARAHYVYAEILAHNARFTQAAAEEARARAIDPSLKFSDPAKVRAFEELLDREQRRVRTDGTPLGGLAGSVAPGAATSVAPSRPVVSDREQPPAARVAPAGLPRWVWLAGLIALVFVAWRMLRRSPVAASGPVMGSPAYGAGGGGYGPGPVMGAPGGAMPGSGMMGVGLAAAGGVAAGMLAEKLLERGHESRGGDPFYGGSAATGPAYDADARALEDRSVDFGNGGADWGGDAGSVDVGGGGSDDGGW